MSDRATPLVAGLVEEIAKAGSRLCDTRMDREKRIHKARLAIKRARALLRVLKPEIAEEAGLIAADLKAAAKLMASARDADVMVATARDLAVSLSPGPALDELERLIVVLAAEADAAHHSELATDDILAHLGAAEMAARDLAVARSDRALYRAGLVRAYKCGRRDCRKARKGADGEVLHDWRDRIKQRLYIARFIGEAAPDGPKSRLRLDNLQENLGAEHDFALLGERIAADPTLSAEVRDELSAAIAGRRRRIAKSAVKAGCKLYRDKPDAYAKRIRKRFRKHFA